MNGYPFAIPVSVRWRDVDAFRHVNNAVVVSYLEIARAEMWRDRFGGESVMDIPFVIARLEIDYLRPIRLYDEVEVGLRAADIGKTSFAFEYRIEADGTKAADARTVQVCIRHESGRPTRVPEAIREVLENLTAS